MKITRLSSKNQNQDQIDQSDDSIVLIQIKYIRNLLTRHEMKDCALVSTSMTEIKLKKPLSKYKCFENHLKQFQILLEKLMHLMMQIRFDLTYSVSRFAQFMSNWTDDH